MHVSLTDKLGEYVRGKVASGLYNNASEVIREALRLKIATEEQDEARLQRLRDTIDPAWEQAERGSLRIIRLKRPLPGCATVPDGPVPSCRPGRCGSRFHRRLYAGGTGEG